MLRRLISLLATYSHCFAPASLARQAATSSGTFNVLSISIHGISSLLVPDDGWSYRDVYTKYIGQKISEYDYEVINDFNYHATLYKYDNHPFRTATSGGALIPGGSGLNTLSKRLRDKEGTGFTFMRVRIEEGVYIDMINLRASNGAPDDVTPRHQNIKQLVNFIKVNSAGNAVIVFGDTYSRYTRSKDNIHLLTTQTGLTDAWVQTIGGDPPAAGADAMECPKGAPPNINCEVGDKVFYRGSPTINLNSTGFFYDNSRFLSPKGDLLTDHNPVRVEFAYTLTNGLRQSKPYGGPHGTWFNDLASIPVSPKLKYVILRGDQRLDRITLALTSGQTFNHGGSGGHPYSLYMTEGEYVKSVKLCWGKTYEHTRIFYAQVSTNWEKQVQAGNLTNDCATFTPPSEHAVVGTYGRSGSEVDQLGFIYAPVNVPPATTSTMSTRTIAPEPTNVY